MPWLTAEHPAQHHCISVTTRAALRATAFIPTSPRPTRQLRQRASGALRAVHLGCEAICAAARPATWINCPLAMCRAAVAAPARPGWGRNRVAGWLRPWLPSLWATMVACTFVSIIALSTRVIGQRVDPDCAEAPDVVWGGESATGSPCFPHHLEKYPTARPDVPAHRRLCGGGHNWWHDPVHRGHVAPANGKDLGGHQSLRALPNDCDIVSGCEPYDQQAHILPYAPRSPSEVDCFVAIPLPHPCCHVRHAAC